MKTISYVSVTTDLDGNVVEPLTTKTMDIPDSIKFEENGEAEINDLLVFMDSPRKAVIGHSPGPWVIDHQPYCISVESERFILSEQYLPEEDDEDSAEQVANAYLMAAAPDLLEAATLALREMRNTTSPAASFMAAVDALDAAIAKVKHNRP
ncbi:hypothetical protein QN366_04915 [Pseudomonas sp. CCC3.2]|uniref:hypothetical protein n=1 Tax=unclassified Pseudomonas TaxID=196821 RepID=UPI002AB456AD|nr:MULTISPECIES: hypothetical protein [unclassified Pseudomonas]MDY7559945.1 hypothetical protein [Pseudomonas sp. AB6]MEB0179415.1 hypothetical protein [Pseudomonas sp. CCC3.2]MEB0210481.1 hypothetical protein [Pseudomonas sp. AB6]